MRATAALLLIFFTSAAHAEQWLTRTWVRWALAIVAPGVAMLINFPLQEMLAGRAPLLPFFVALAIVALGAGFAPGLLALALSEAMLARFWTVPLDRWTLAGPNVSLLAAFLVAGIALVALASYARRSMLEQQQIRQRMNLALLAGQMVAWDWDLISNEVTVLEGDRAVTRLSRAPAAEMLNHLHPEDRECAQAAVRQALGDPARQKFHFLAREMIESSQQVRWIEVHGHIDRDTSGRALSVSGITADVTERTEVQQALDRENRRKDEFLATLGHELRNPLAPIRYAVPLLADTVPAPARERARQVIARQCAQMARLLDDLLDMSRITHNQIELRKEVLDLRQLAADILDDMRSLIEAHGHQLSFAAPDHPLWVLADPARLQQILVNLIDNACKYSKAEGRIDVRLSLREGRACIDVIDEGYGLTPAMQRDIFGVFVRAHTAHDSDEGGLGIGLALVKRLTELHGGVVQVYSAGLDRGSRFTVCLPQAQPG